MARKREILDVSDRCEDDVKALGVEPLLTDVTSDHVGRLLLLTDAIKLVRVAHLHNRLVVNERQALLRLQTCRLELGVLVGM